MSSRIIYWLVSKYSEHHDAKVNLMRRRGMSPLVFTDYHELIEAFNQKRASIVMISDIGMPEHVKKVIDVLLCTPEFKGVRFVLSVEANYSMLKKHAALWCFRDLIPISDPDELWMQRLNFSTGSGPEKFQMPRGMLRASEICSLSVPARVVAINETYMQIETPLKPPVGSTLTLRGSISESLNCEQLILKIVRRSSDRLNYRFSDSLVASWEAPSASPVAKQMFLDQLQEEHASYQPRAFVVLKSQVLRSELLPILSNQAFNVSSALHKTNIEHDPRFFSPDIVLIEDDLCKMDEGSYLRLLCRHLEKRVPVIIVGRRAESVHIPPDLQAGVTIAKLPNFDGDFVGHLRSLTEASRNAIANGKREDKLISVPSTHDASYNFLTFPGRIRELHPLGIQISHAVEINNFAICQVHSPFLKKTIGKDPFIKITDAFEGNGSGEEQFIYGSSGYLADVNNENRSSLAEGITRLCSQLLNPYVMRIGANQLTQHAEDRILRNILNSNISESALTAAQDRPVSGETGSASSQPAHPNAQAPSSMHAKKMHPSRNVYVAYSAPKNTLPSVRESRPKRIHNDEDAKKFYKNLLVAALVIGVMLGIGLAAALLIEPDPQAAKAFSDPFVRMKRHDLTPSQPANDQKDN